MHKINGAERPKALANKTGKKIYFILVFMENCPQHDALHDFSELVLILRMIFGFDAKLEKLIPLVMSRCFFSSVFTF